MQYNFILGKHPVSLLGEYCSKKKLGAPIYELCFECGPDHRKNFLFKVSSVIMNMSILISCENIYIYIFFIGKGKWHWIQTKCCKPQQKTGKSRSSTDMPAKFRFITSLKSYTYDDYAKRS